VGFGLEVVWVGKDAAPPTPGELHVPPGLLVLKNSTAIFSVLGLKGLLTFGGSPLIGHSLLKSLD
jgi:hypothetical protein